MWITGGTGLIGSFLTDVLLCRNRTYDMNCSVTVLGRSKERAVRRFGPEAVDRDFRFVSCDVAREGIPDLGQASYILHLASNTHPVSYAADPIGTIMVNVLGTDRLLRYGADHGTKRFLFASSVEVYGQNRGDCAAFREDYCGYLDCNTLRGGYPESKRVGEALCQAYRHQRGMDVVIPRLSRVYGPTMIPGDSKALSQFIQCGLNGEDIVLKSQGNQHFSYTYVADAVSGILYCLSAGVCGEAYNVATPGSDITLKALAQLVADLTGGKVVHRVPEAREAEGFSRVTRAVQSAQKLIAMGWQPRWDIAAGVGQTIQILKSRKG